MAVKQNGAIVSLCSLVVAGWCFARVFICRGDGRHGTTQPAEQKVKVTGHANTRLRSVSEVLAMLAALPDKKKPSSVKLGNTYGGPPVVVKFQGVVCARRKHGAQIVFFDVIAEAEAKVSHNSQKFSHKEGEGFLTAGLRDTVFDYFCVVFSRYFYFFLVTPGELISTAGGEGQAGTIIGSHRQRRGS